MQVISCPTRAADPGTNLGLMVLCDGPEGCAAVDVSSGALVRGRYSAPAGSALAPFDLVRAVIAEDPDCPDPTQPEAVALAGPPERVGRLRRRQVRRLVAPLLLPAGEQPFGFPGSAAQYWTVPGDRPSLAVLAPQRPALVRDRGEGDVVCRFGWAGVEVELPVADQPVRRAAGPRSVLTGGDLEQLLGFAPTLLVLALSDPQDGRCYKVVVGFLPRP
ncbi:MAG TPA: hypothetical protein VFW24_07975 [Acidimicrobiales bacterium]|nr:hypothetical protein [Acidimicrobiales bacterium]